VFVALVPNECPKVFEFSKALTWQQSETVSIVVIPEVRSCGGQASKKACDTWLWCGNEVNDRWYDVLQLSGGHIVKKFEVCCQKLMSNRL
jgi:hypothetical protein